MKKTSNLYIIYLSHLYYYIEFDFFNNIGIIILYYRSAVI